MLDALVGPLAVAAVEVHHFGAVVGRLVVVVVAARVIDGVLLSKISSVSKSLKLFIWIMNNCCTLEKDDIPIAH